MAWKESSSGLKSQVRVWLDGEERCVFVIEERIINKLKKKRWREENKIRIREEK